VDYPLHLGITEAGTAYSGSIKSAIGLGVLLAEGIDLTELKNDPPIEGYRRFLAQFNSYRQKILNGAQQLQKLTPDSPEPPLVMPTWKHTLTEADIQAILAYLISEYPWGEND